MGIDRKILQMGEKYSYINGYLAGMRNRGPHTLRPSTMVSLDEIHKQLLRFLIHTVSGNWQMKLVSPRELVFIRKVEGVLKSFWIDWWGGDET